MDLARFNADDIHELRVELAKRRAQMSPEEAERDYQESVAKTRHAIERIRRQKNKAVI